MGSGKAFGLQPHRTETFKPSNDPQLVEKVREFVWTKSADAILARIARFAQRTLDARTAQQMSRTTVTGH